MVMHVSLHLATRTIPAQRTYVPAPSGEKETRATQAGGR